jgi:hypothetical protein
MQPKRRGAAGVLTALEPDSGDLPGCPNATIRSPAAARFDALRSGPGKRHRKRKALIGRGYV